MCGIVAILSHQKPIAAESLEM
ncbi:MAG: hypothetical protein QOK48_167, partial [Blastocatellia bacterium]|nr:hypothetical protein [Blastocatellia bacterium]